MHPNNRNTADLRGQGRRSGWHPMIAGLLVVTAGTACSALAVWLAWLMLPSMFPRSAVTVMCLALFYAGFFVSVFAGVEIMDAVESSRSLTLASLRTGVVTGFVDMLRPESGLVGLYRRARAVEPIGRSIAALSLLARMAQGVFHGKQKVAPLAED